MARTQENQPSRLGINAAKLSAPVSAIIVMATTAAPIHTPACCESCSTSVRVRLISSAAAASRLEPSIRSSCCLSWSRAAVSTAADPPLADTSRTRVSTLSAPRRIVSHSFARVRSFRNCRISRGGADPSVTRLPDR